LQKWIIPQSKFAGTNGLFFRVLFDGSLQCWRIIWNFKTLEVDFNDKTLKKIKVSTKNVFASCRKIIL
jgi:hypothetical protein